MTRRVFLRVTAISSLVIWIALHAVAQDYRKIRFAFGVGHAENGWTGFDGKGGPLVFAEPAFRFTDRWMIGIQASATNMTRPVSSRGVIVNPRMSVMSASCLLQYYFSRKLLRPFIAGGVGWVTMNHETLEYQRSGTSYSFLVGDNGTCIPIRIGAERGHFFVSLEYLFKGDEQVSPFLEMKNSFASIRIGFFVGGGLN